MLEQVSFVRPYWLWCLIPLLILVVWLWQQTYRGDNRWNKVCDKHLLPHLEFVHFGRYQKHLPLILLAIGWLLTILALAGLSWSKAPPSVYRSEQARVLILDLSSTMDVKLGHVSRLQQTKYKLRDILNQYSQEGQTALVVFAGEAYVVSPLTDDANLIAHYVSALKTSLMRVPGQRTGLALQKARELLEHAGAKHGHVLLITDKVDDSQRHFVEARQLRKQGHRLSILAVGTVQSAPTFRNLAEQGGGNYVMLTVNDDSDLNQLLKSTHLSQHGEPMNQKHEQQQDQGYWLLLLLLPLAALSFRRGWLGVLLFCVIGLPQPSYALDWNELWQRPDQQAAEILNQGVVHYRNGQYQEAAAAFAHVKTAQGYYNLGNALAYLGEYEEAITAYETALNKNDQYAAAKHNRAIVKQLLEQQQSKKTRQQQSSPPKAGDKKRTGASEKETPKDNIEEGKGAIKKGQLTKTGKEGQVDGPQEQTRRPPPPKQAVENEQRLEQWLEKVDGDLAELLERKFQHQAQPSQ